jgi:hypothetical protein
MLEFVKAWTPKPTEATTPAPPATIPAALREHQQQRAQQFLIANGNSVTSWAQQATLPAP